MRRTVTGNSLLIIHDSRIVATRLNAICSLAYSTEADMEVRFFCGVLPVWQGRK